MVEPSVDPEMYASPFASTARPPGESNALLPKLFTQRRCPLGEILRRPMSRLPTGETLASRTSLLLIEKPKRTKRFPFLSYATRMLPGGEPFCDPNE